jgi:hypothetical protein
MHLAELRALGLPGDAKQLRDGPSRLVLRGVNTGDLTASLEGERGDVSAVAAQAGVKAGDEENL